MSVFILPMVPTPAAFYRMYVPSNASSLRLLYTHWFSSNLKESVLLILIVLESSNPVVQ